MGVEAFGGGDGLDCGGGFFQGGLVVVDDAGLFEEIIDVQGAEEAGGAACGQGVRRAGEIITSGDGAEGADENGTGVLNLLGNGIAIAALHLEVFDGEFVGESYRFVEIFGDDGEAVFIQTLTRLGGAVELGELGVQFAVDLIGKFGGIGEQHGGAGGVFGLAEQIGGDPVGAGGIVCDDKHFAGAGEAVDVNEAVNFFFG